MTENLREKSENKACEACGREFSCGAKSESCWCFDVDLSAGTLSNLRAEYSGCVCRECLLSRELTSIYKPKNPNLNRTNS
jgi:hypothetical protein